MIRAKNSTINNATEAGKDTELRPIRLSTPQQANRTNKTPIGTYNHAVSDRRHASCQTCVSSQYICLKTVKGPTNRDVSNVS